MCIYPIDLDNDSDTDIIASGSSNLYYLLNDGSQNFTKYEFASVAGNNHFQSLYPVDFDDDSDIDIIYATDTDVIINGYENDCSENFTLHNIDPSIAASSVKAIDIYGDVDLDVVATTRDGDAIVRYENK